jgi:hypothetical protein
MISMSTPPIAPSGFFRVNRTTVETHDALEAAAPDAGNSSSAGLTATTNLPPG